ncbi:MAG: hypothetical protein LBG48_00630, partial [Rickettsiales bacterium]|nr:hypothetical protein [Rickettsiales bacterium]
KFSDGYARFIILMRFFIPDTLSSRTIGFSYLAIPVFNYMEGETSCKPIIIYYMFIEQNCQEIS